MSQQKNVLGEPLEVCCKDPITGFTRNGFCELYEQDPGVHTVCAQMTHEFLTFSKAKGNDLITPMPQFDFPGLKPGDCWCLCVARWLQALEADCAPPLKLASCHESILEFVELDILRQHTLN